MDSKFVWKGKRLRTANRILKKNKVRVLTLLDFNTYETIVCQYRMELVKKQTHRSIESNSPEIDQHRYSYYVGAKLVVV